MSVNPDECDQLSLSYVRGVSSIVLPLKAVLISREANPTVRVDLCQLFRDVLNT